MGPQSRVPGRTPRDLQCLEPRFGPFRGFASPGQGSEITKPEFRESEKPKRGVDRLSCEERKREVRGCGKPADLRWRSSEAHGAPPATGRRRRCGHRTCRATRCRHDCRGAAGQGHEPHQPRGLPTPRSPAGGDLIAARYPRALSGLTKRWASPGSPEKTTACVPGAQGPRRGLGRPLRPLLGHSLRVRAVTL